MKRSPMPPRTTKLKAKRGTSTAALKRKATSLHSQYVRQRDGACVRCGAMTGQLQCAHIISRRYAATRTYGRNAACLCATCHRRLTEHPHEHVAFFTTWLGSWDEYQALIDKANSGVGIKFNSDYWKAEITRLLGLLEDVQQT